jgi:hypothetical protein
MAANNINFANNGKARFGNQANLQIHSDGSNSYIDNAGVTQSTFFRVSDANALDTTALTISRNGDLTTGRDVTIAGDLTVNGTTTTVNSQTLAVVDPLIQLAKDNTANSLDIGLYGDYNDGTGRYLGLFSDASDSNKFKLFKGTTVEPTTTVNIGAAGYVAADLQVAGLESSSFISTGAVRGSFFVSTTDGGLSINGMTLTRIAANSAIRASNGLETLGLLRSYAGLAVGTTGTFGGNVDVTGNLSLKSDSAYFNIKRANNTDLGYITDSSTWGDSGTDFSIGASSANLKFYTNNSTAVKLTLDASGNATFAGNVLINKPSNPTSLQIGSNLTDDPFIVFQTDGNTMSMGIDRGDSNKFKISDNATLGTNDRFTIDTSGNVGIGTDSPDSPLQVNGYMSLDSISNNSASVAGEYRLALGHDASTDASWIQSNGVSGTQRKLLLNPLGGNVGIGTTSPAFPLEVQNVSTAYVFSETTGAAASSGYRWKTPDSEFAWFSTGGTNAMSLYDYVAGAERMRIDSSGNVGIGVTPNASYSKLQVKAPDSSYGFDLVGRDAGSNGESQITFWNSNQTTQLAAIFNTSDNLLFVTGTTERMRITSGGEFGFGTSSDTVINGSVYIKAVDAANTVIKVGHKTGSVSGADFIAFYYNNVQIGGVAQNGTTAVSFNTTSDYRLKEDLKDFAGLDIVSKIPVYDYKWKADKSRSYGVMAHELQDVLPDAVTGEKDAEEMQGVDYSKIVPLLVKSIQELKAKVEKLESQNCKCKI